MIINNIEDLKEELYKLKKRLEREYSCVQYCHDCPLFSQTSCVCLSGEINDLYHAAASLHASLKAILEGETK